MKHVLFLIGVSFLLLCCSASAESKNQVEKRAEEIATAWSQQRYEESWKTKIIPEYIHSDTNDSGMQSRYPDFLQEIDLSGGIFLFSKMTIGNIKEGRSPFILQGIQDVVCVEIIYTVIAEVGEVTTVYAEAKTRSKYFVMAIDKVDNKWKYVDSYPYKAYFYSVPYFFKRWEKISGKGSINNIDQILKQLKIFE
jgi:hypothetical protein